MAMAALGAMQLLAVGDQDWLGAYSFDTCAGCGTAFDRCRLGTGPGLFQLLWPCSIGGSHPVRPGPCSGA